MNTYLFAINVSLQSMIAYNKAEIYRNFIIDCYDDKNPDELKKFVLSLATKKEYEKHPNDYWAEKYNDRPFIEDTFDSHVSYWSFQIAKINNWVNKISLLSTDKKFKKICNKFSEEIGKVFYVAPGYKNSQKSFWFQNSQSYREFLENRENLKPIVKELFDNFEQNVVKYLGDKQ